MRKKLIVGDSHLKKIKRNKLHNLFRKAKCVMESFSGARIQDLEHYVTPHFEHDKPDIVVIHLGTNNVSYNNLDKYASILAENIIKVENKCIDFVVEELVISPIFVKESIRLSSIIRKLNDELRFLCSSLIYFILFQMITLLESIYVGMVCI